MKNIIALGLAAAPVLAFAGSGLYGDAPDAKHAWAVHDWNRAKPGNKNEVHILNKALDVLVRVKVIPASAKLAE